MTAVRMAAVSKYVAILAMAAAAACSGPAPTATSAGRATDAPNTGPTVDTGSALVQLRGDPLSTDARTHPPQGKKIDFSSSTVRARRAELSALRNDFKQWLRANAPAAKVTGEYDISLNAVAVRLNGVALATIASAPQVVRAEYQGFYYPTSDPTVDPDLTLVNAFAGWAAGGDPAHAGEGVKVAVVDTGIDFTHPCFDDSTYPAQTQLGDKRFTNNKVIAAKVFNNKTPSRGFTAEALQEHGTHVSGTVACNAGTAATVSGATILHPIAGVAPRALLGNYNVFPADVGSARSEDIMNALDAAYADGFDVANMSLGGGASGIQDLLTIAVDNLDEANMVVAVAAGNSGPGHFTVQSPGSAARALTAGAATVGHIVAAKATVGGDQFPAVSGSFATVSADLTAPLSAVAGTGVNGLNLACNALPAGSLTGKIGLVVRGVCTFSTKIRNAQAAGAVAVLVSNNVAGDGIAMGQDGTANQPTIPAYMLSRTDGLAIKAHDGGSTTITKDLFYFDTDNDDFMASFSSQGPTDVDFRVKPDVVAPGVNVLSSIPHQFCATPPCFAFFQGTSMATPHLAGTAAIVRWAHPDWSAAEVRSAVVNTADQGTLKKSTSTALEKDPLIIGTGRVDVLSAVTAAVAVDPVSASFGSVPSGSGQMRTFDVSITNLGAAGTFSVAVGAGGGGVAFSVAPPSVTLATGDSATVTVTMSADKGAALGDHSATLTVGGSEGGAVAHAVVYTFVK
ncbi:MAG TPA: S8 family serine peptidase [Anaeromyxobacter sp.]